MRAAREEDVDFTDEEDTFNEHYSDGVPEVIGSTSRLRALEENARTVQLRKAKR